MSKVQEKAHNTVKELEQEYQSAFQDYLANEGEAPLQRAYELGRRAMAENLGVLEMLAVHRTTLETILRETKTAEESLRKVHAADGFLMESLAPFEITHRGFREANIALRSLNQKLEEEIKRVAHALHDEVGQLLTSVQLALAEAAGELQLSHRERLQKIRSLLDDVELQMRRLTHELRPTILDDLGLIPALEFLAQGASKRAGIPVAVESSKRKRLPPGLEIVLYRVIQEALTNALKHAKATRVKIKVQWAVDVVSSSIQDDGRGFDASTTLAAGGGRGLGLLGMRERLDTVGGKFLIKSSPGRGTDVLITIPLEH